MRAGRRNVRITHPDKVLFPDADHEGRPRRVLPRRRAGDAAPRPRPARVDAALQRRHRRGPASSTRTSRRARRSGCRRVEVPKKGGTVRHVLANEAADARVAGQPELHHAARVDGARRPPRPPRPDRVRPRPVGRRLRPRAPHGARRSARSCARRAASRTRWSPARAASTSSSRSAAATPTTRCTTRRSRSRTSSSSAAPHELTTEFCKEKRDGPAVRRRQPQRPGADRGAAVRRAPAAGRAGRHAAALGGARRPRACRPTRWTLRDRARAPRARRRPVGRHRPRGRRAPAVRLIARVGTPGVGENATHGVAARPAPDRLAEDRRPELPRASVVYWPSTRDEGAMGLVLNRPAETTVGEAVPDLEWLAERRRRRRLRRRPGVARRR